MEVAVGPAAGCTSKIKDLFSGLRGPPNDSLSVPTDNERQPREGVCHQYREERREVERRWSTSCRLMIERDPTGEGCYQRR